VSFRRQTGLQSMLHVTLTHQ